MKILVVYDSVFGNTEKIAQAIGNALSSQAEVMTLRVGEVQPEHLSGLGLFIVGSPTRGFRPTPATTGFLKQIPSNGLQGVKVAAFDTRIAVDEVKNGFLTFMVKIFGYAAKPIADGLKKTGGVLLAAPEGFFVKGSEGPLKDGELERAAAWASQIVTASH